MTIAGSIGTFAFGNTALARKLLTEAAVAPFDTCTSSRTGMSSTSWSGTVGTMDSLSWVSTYATDCGDPQSGAETITFSDSYTSDCGGIYGPGITQIDECKDVSSDVATVLRTTSCSDGVGTQTVSSMSRPSYSYSHSMTAHWTTSWTYKCGWFSEDPEDATVGDSAPIGPTLDASRSVLDVRAALQRLFKLTTGVGGLPRPSER